MRAVNLLPREETRQSFGGTRTRIGFAAGGGALVVTAAVAALTLSAAGTVTERQAELDAVEAQIAALPPVVRDTSANDALAAQRNARIAALSTALAGRIGWDRVLRQLSLVLPDDVWLTSLQGGSGGDGAAGSPLTLTGSTYSQEGVARLLARLEVVPALENVQLQGSTSVESDGRRLVQFTVVADVRSAVGGAS